MLEPRDIANALTAALRRGAWDAASLTAQAQQRLQAKSKWITRVCERAAKAFSSRPRRSELIEHLILDPDVVKICEGDSFKLWMAVHREPPPQPPEWLNAAELRALPTLGELGRWLGLGPRKVAWFANAWDRPSHPTQPGSPTAHYHHRFHPKRSGGWRLLEAPKDKLKALQREILVGILDAVAWHPAAHALRPGRSHLTAAAPHVAQAVVLRIDLANFFASIRAARVAAIFRELGYRPAVAKVLAQLCTHRTPRPIVNDERIAPALARLLDTRHLPQGAPTSPALANLCAYRLDCRLAALAQAAGANYTRYADDLLFSGGADFARSARRLTTAVAAIALDEGFRVEHRKTRLMRRSVRQHSLGLVINDKPNLDRREFDRLKATLTNCVRHGPDSQNRAGVANFRDHLRAKIAYVQAVNPPRGARLLQIWERIVWPTA
jgi:hypothetical protein